MKKAILMGMVLILTLLFMISCGVPQNQYNKVSNDLASAQTQIQFLQGDLIAAETKIQSLQGELSTKESDLTAAQAQIQSLQGELSTKEAELSAKESKLEGIKEKLEQGKARIEILNAIFIPAMTGELDEMTEGEAINYFFEWRDTVRAVEDPVLTAKFDAMIETFSDEALFSFFLYLLESTADTLG